MELRVGECLRIHERDPLEFGIVSDLNNDLGWHGDYKEKEVSAKSGTILRQGSFLSSHEPSWFFFHISLFSLSILRK